MQLLFLNFLQIAYIADGMYLECPLEIINVFAPSRDGYGRSLPKILFVLSQVRLIVVT